ncbi:MAG: hypothetical protein FJX75_10655 [Armatimonadetes bacterium]|nr:hypothetical protein [Armatimonadota bacterium]
MRKIFERAGSVLRANLKTILGRSREPSQTAAQMVREIEEALHRTKAKAAQTAADTKRLERAHGRTLRQAGEWSRRAVQALRQGREEVAAEAVRREKSLQGSAAALADKLLALEARDVDIRSEALALQARLDEAKLRLRHLRAREGALESESDLRALGGSLTDPTRPGDVERLEAQLDTWEAELQGREAAEGASLRRQLREIDGQLPEVQARLEELRRSLAEQEE